MSQRLARLALLLAASAALAGCLTHTAKVEPSAAIQAARAGAHAKPAACPPGDLASVSPTQATFPFEDSLLDEVGAQRLKRVAAWLVCHPQTPVVVLPSADNHGDAAHRKDLASRRGQAVLAALRADGVQAVAHLQAAGAPDPLSDPHVVIQAIGRGW